MGGWNLPPGCNVWDIPGNRPEDEAWEKMMDEFYATLPKEQRGKLDSIDGYDAISKALDYGINLGRREQTDIEKENKFYERQYHQEVRNPKLREFFKKQRQTIRDMYMLLYRIANEFRKGIPLTDNYQKAGRQRLELLGKIVAILEKVNK